MKKSIFVLVLMCVIANCCACAEEQKKHISEDYQEGYEKGYKEAKKSAVKELREEAEGDWESYVEIEQLEDIIRLNYGDDADEIIDAIIYHPDTEQYNTLDIVDKVIEDSSLYYYDESVAE